MHVFERAVNGHRYRIAAQSVWDPVRGRSVARQVVLGPAEPPPVADLGATRTVGTRAVGDVGALIWVAEQLDLIAHIDRACGHLGAKDGPSVGELAVAVAIQRACAPGPKGDLGDFLDGSVPRLSCLPGSAFSGQVFHRVAQQVTERALVRDGGFWSPQLELGLDSAGYYSIISLPLGHAAAEAALQMAVRRGAMQRLSGKLKHVRAARMRTTVGKLDRTLVVVESEELLEGQKRGIALALRKAKVELRKLERLVQAGRLARDRLEQRCQKALAREHLSSFVVTSIAGNDQQPTFHWEVDAALRRQLEKTRLGRRVLCTDQHNWSTGRIVYAFRGQWNVEELFRRAKKGGVVPWGPSHQWADGSLRLHTFATVLGLMLVSLAKLALGTEASARETMKSLAEIRATLVRTTTGGTGRRPPVMLAPDLTTYQRRAVRIFNLERWFPSILSCMTARPV